MTNIYNKLTRNIRIPQKTHEMIKSFCKQEGRLISAYVDFVLKEDIANKATLHAGDQAPDLKD